jgi:hypothetical protein
VVSVLGLAICPVPLSSKLGTGAPHESASPVGPYRRPMSRVLGGSLGVGCFLINEVPLYWYDGQDQILASTSRQIVCGSLQVVPSSPGSGLDT